MNQPHQASIAFGSSLKTFGRITYRPFADRDETTEARMVVDFNSSLFHQKCNVASPEYDESINLDVVAQELFKVSEIWSSRDTLLLPALDDLSKIHGFHLTKVKTSI